MACLIETGKFFLPKARVGMKTTLRVGRNESRGSNGAIMREESTQWGRNLRNESYSKPEYHDTPDLASNQDKHRLVLIIIPEKSLDLSMAYLHVNVDQLQNNSRHAASPVYGLIYQNCH